MSPTTTKKKRTGPVCDGRVALERRALELSKSCPADLSNPRECPLCDLRLLTARERRLWIHNLSVDELEYLATYHTCCYVEKMAAVAR